MLRTLCLFALIAALPPFGAAEDEAPAPFPDMARVVGEFIAHDYYDADRIDPRLMVERALRSLEAADVAIDAVWQGDALHLHIGEDRFRLSAPDPRDLDAAMTILERVRRALDHPRFDPPRRRNLSYAMLNGALASLDPHTVIIPPQPADRFSEEIEGEFFGIGAYLTQEDGLVRIDRVMPGLPADDAGVRDGDRILGVDGEKVLGLSLAQTVRRIKGPKGTEVVLTVEREGAEEPLDISIVRDRVQIIAMRSVRRGSIGYTRMDEFNRQTARELLRNVIALQQRGPLAAYVIDLRFNAGGLLSQAKVISDLFLSAGQEIVRTVSPGSDGEPLLAGPRILLDVPMVVLTGSGSASAAEILAGSLQLNDRAVVIGATTFGKGSVQTIRSLPDDSQLKLTIQEYQLRGGASIQERGVEPDVLLLRHSTAEDGRIDLIPYPLRREGDDEFALRDHGTYEHEVHHRLGWLREHQSREDMREHNIANPEFRPDQEADLVIDLVAAAMQDVDASALAAASDASGGLRSFLLERLAEPIARRSEVEADRLASALQASAQIPWGEAVPVGDDQIELAYRGPDTIRAGEDAVLTFAVRNTGEHAVGRLYGLVRADERSPFWEEEVIIGAVPAGATTTAELHFAVPPRLHRGRERFRLEVFMLGRAEPVAELPVEVAVDPQPRPQLAYRWSLLDDDGQIDLDEPTHIRIHVRNTGDGATAPLVMYAFKDDDHFVQLGEGRISLEAIPAGGSTSVDLPIRVRGSVTVGRNTHRYHGDAVSLQLRIEEDFGDDVDQRYRASLFHTLEIPVDAPFPAGAVAPPQLELVAIDRPAPDRAAITVAVADDDLAYVAVFVDEDKVGLYPADAVSDGRLTAAVTLSPGVNGVRLVAADSADVIEVLPLRLWGPPLVASDEDRDTAAAVDIP